MLYENQSKGKCSSKSGKDKRAEEEEESDEESEDSDSDDRTTIKEKEIPRELVKRKRGHILDQDRETQQPCLQPGNV